MRQYYYKYRNRIRTLITFGLLLMLSGISDPSARQPIKVQAYKVVSYNIRLDTDADGINAWPLRKGKVVKLLKNHKPDVFGLQEVMFHQMEYISLKMPDYERVGLCRDDGKTVGEASPVFYNKSKFKAGRSGTFWLSETPSVIGSRGWDAAYNRVVTWIELLPLNTVGKPFMVFNTHFDHMGKSARLNSAKLILHAIDSLADGMNVILTGDFNARPDDEPIQIITKSTNPVLYDSRLIALSKADPGYTFTGFRVKDHETEQIDYIFVSNNWIVKNYKIDEHSRKGFYPSDHLPVIATISMK